jgi:O-antigen/teichoic acid export membrane protein
MNIGRKDVIWNYAATFLKIGVGVILLPFILRTFSQETVAIWSIFTTVITLTNLFDFGFNSSFSRNVTYIVSGVKTLKITGYQTVENGDSEIDYSLFKGLIEAMKWFYSRMAMILFLLLSTVGTYYIHIILKTYSESHTEVYIAWIILCIINSYSLYTFYYESLMQGKGLIKRAKQIDVIGYTVYLIVAIVMILFRFNLIAIVSAQVLMIFIKRVFSYQAIYTNSFRHKLKETKAQSKKNIFKLIFPNAIKAGLNLFGRFVFVRVPLLIGSLFFSLEQIASYGITKQLVEVIWTVGAVYSFTYQPQMSQYRIQKNHEAIKLFYLKSCWFQFFSFIVCGFILIFSGNWLLHLIGSQTFLLSKDFILVLLIVFLLESNHGIAEGVILTKNEVPFFKSSLITAVITLVLLWSALNYTNLGIWGLILTPAIAQLGYQNWKWPVQVIQDLDINKQDIYNSIKNISITKNIY